jgi:hypothetical protein
MQDLTKAIAKLIQERYEFSPGLGIEPEVVAFSVTGKAEEVLTAKAGSE